MEGTEIEVPKWKRFYLQHRETILAKQKARRLNNLSESLKKERLKRLRNLDRVRFQERRSQRKRRQEIKLEIYSLLGNHCIKCGFNDKRALEIDHKDPRMAKKEPLRCQSVTYYRRILERIKSGSKDYQLMCCNCNRIKAWEEYWEKEEK